MRIGLPCWLIGLSIGLQVAVATRAADSEERFRAGTIELALVYGYSVNGQFGPDREFETVAGFHSIPHVGYFVTDEVGTSWLRGNLELVVEPTLGDLKGPESSTVGGISLLGRWVFAGWPRVRPYFEIGAGVLGGELDVGETKCDTNFVLQGGPGLLVFLSPTTAVTVGYRYHHISNAGLCEDNLGVNSSFVVLGFSLLFP